MIEITSKIEIGANIKKQRKILGISQKKLAVAVNLPQYKLSRIETGKSEATADELKQIANILAIPLATILGRAKVKITTELADQLEIAAAYIRDSIKDKEEA